MAIRICKKTFTLIFSYILTQETANPQTTAVYLGKNTVDKYTSSRTWRFVGRSWFIFLFFVFLDLLMHIGKTKLPLSTNLIHIHKMFLLKGGEKKIYIKSQSEQSEIEQMMFLSLPLAYS